MEMPLHLHEIAGRFVLRNGFSARCNRGVAVSLLSDVFVPVSKAPRLPPVLASARDKITERRASRYLNGNRNNISMEHFTFPMEQNISVIWQSAGCRFQPAKQRKTRVVRNVAEVGRMVRPHYAQIRLFEVSERPREHTIYERTVTSRLVRLAAVL